MDSDSEYTMDYMLHHEEDELASNGEDSDYMLHYEEDEWASNGEDSETSDPNSREIDYPDASEVYWSDEEEANFHRRDSSRCSPVLRARRRRIRTGDYTTSRRFAFHPYTRRYNSLKNKTKTESAFSNKTVQPKNTSGDCAICLIEVCVDNKTEEHLYCSSECGNVFHKACITKYTEPKTPDVAKCPLCRRWSNFKKLEKDSKITLNN